MNVQPDIDTLRDRFGPSPLLFELIPPPLETPDEKLEFRMDRLQELFHRVDVDGINLPEVQEETKKSQEGNRRSEFKTRWSPRDYARHLRATIDTEYVINRVIVQSPPEQQEDWFLETYRDYGIRNVVIVGGESSDVTYPGPSVSEGNQMVNSYLNRGKRKYDPPGSPVEPTDFLVGNICIATRRRETFDEPERMIKKIQSGTDFFTTQIVAESEAPRALLQDLSHELRERSIPPPMIFWSFAPIAEQKDVDFMRWLGVQIPDSVERTILGHSSPVERSIQQARTIWNELVETTLELPVPIPIGLNISFMGMRNIDNAIELADRVSSVENPLLQQA